MFFLDIVYFVSLIKTVATVGQRLLSQSQDEKRKFLNEGNNIWIE